ncbi:MAG: isoprenylcysteine carboxylmethyltransferase family protein [candidate division NC10 bacterium]|nr:isoprenylcysteine carboxylmethyltransferase family protein [candidate division NC10 bacterium]
MSSKSPDTLSDALEPERPAVESQSRSDGIRAVWGAAFLFYLLVGLEVIIMVTPFTVYFYSIYAPVLTWLERRAWTAWLTAFFLPHITYSGDPLILALAYAGPVLLTLGLAVFFVCAGQVYGAKLFRKGVVSGGLYRMIRHPQYLGLAIAGLGLLLYWPRFFILITYISMLFVYYLLARNEEGRMLRKFGASYSAYLERTPMFLPGNPGGRFLRAIFWTPQRKGAVLLGLYALSLSAAIAGAFGLRAYSEVRLTKTWGNGMLALAMSPSEPERLTRTLAQVAQNPEIQAFFQKYHTRPGHSLVAYVLPQEYMMQHLIADMDEHKAHHGEGEQGGFLAVVKHLGEMYALKPLRQLGEGAAAAAQRIIFTEALDPAGQNVGVGRALGISVQRYPLFFADFDAKAGQVTLTMETPRRHTWGTIPVPAF